MRKTSICMHFEYTWKYSNFANAPSIPSKIHHLNKFRVLPSFNTPSTLNIQSIKRIFDFRFKNQKTRNNVTHASLLMLIYSAD